MWGETDLDVFIKKAEAVNLDGVIEVLVRGEDVTVGAATTAALFFHRLFNPVSTLVFTFDEFQAAGASLSRLVGVVEMPVERPAGALYARPPSKEQPSMRRLNRALGAFALLATAAVAIEGIVVTGQGTEVRREPSSARIRIRGANSNPVAVQSVSPRTPPAATTSSWRRSASARRRST